MSRFLRALFLVLGGAALVFAGRFILAWFAERRRRQVYPASQAAALLNPLRERLMPVEKTLDRFGVSSDQTVLEVGPGPGYYTLKASGRIGDCGRILCFDIQRGMLETLRRRLEDADVHNADLVIADATHLPLAAGCVDVAFLVTVLGEVPEPEAALAELRRVLKPGGRLGFGETMRDPDYVLLGRMRRMCRAQGFEVAAYYREFLGYTITFRVPGA